VLAATLVPWYRVGSDHLSRTAWQEDPIVLVLLLVAVLAGAVLAGARALGPALARHAAAGVFGVTLIATVAVAVRVFIDRPGGNAATAIAYGGYPALLGLNMIKASAVATLARARRGNHKADGSAASADPGHGGAVTAASRHAIRG
jgi:hypothetical protein